MKSLVGTGSLVRLALRRDRVRLAVWMLALSAVTIGTAAAFIEVYPSEQSRAVFAAGVTRNPAFRALVGPVFDAGTVGGLVAWRLGSLGAVLVGLMSLFSVVRHTRAEEEAGRLELVGSGMVGRRAPLTAALAVTALANLAIAGLITAGLSGVGFPVRGALALGLAFAAAGLMFAAIAAVAAQLTENARLAAGMAAGALAVSFLLRAAGDASGESGPTWLSWVSPIGWTQQVRPFAGERWWVLGLAAGLVVVLVGVAYALVARRDIGAGLVSPRLGPAEAGPGLRSPLALAWRLQRGALAGWTIGFVIFGSALGSIALSLSDLLKDNPQLQRMMALAGGSEGLVNGFFNAILGMIAVVASAYGIQSALCLRSEETDLRAEPLLATSVDRVPWAMSHLMFALLGPAVLLLAAGTGAGLAHGLRSGDVGAQLPRLVGAALAHLPAAWVLTGIAVALFGLLPNATKAVWGALTLFLLLGQLGPILKLDRLVMDLSPFTHVPKLPGGEVSIAPLAGLTAVAAALLSVGLAGWRRRDVG